MNFRISKTFRASLAKPPPDASLSKLLATFKEEATTDD